MPMSPFVRRMSVSCVIALAVVATATACSSSSTSGSTGGSGPKPGGTFTLRYADSNPPSDTSTMTEVAKFFIQDVAKLSKGRIKINFFPNSQLGTSDAQVTGLRTGSIDFANVGTATLGTVDPKFYLFTLPFIAPDEQTLYKLLDSDTAKKVEQDLTPLGITALAANDNGPMMFLSNKPIATPQSFKGLKMRAYTSPLDVATVSALGAQSVSMDFPQVYSALKSNALNAVQATPSSFVAGKLVEVAKYANPINPNWFASMLMISNKTMNRLPKDLQAAVKQAGTDTAKKALTFATGEKQRGLDALKAAGVNTATSATIDEFRQASQSVTKEYTAKIGPDLVSQAQKEVS